MKINVGVVGAGSMGQNHARVYSEVANLVGIADIDERAGRAVAKRLNTSYYSDYRELLSKDVEAVSIATPTKSHYAMAKEFMGAGKHVMVEKPMCSGLEESRELIDLARSAGVVLAVGMIERFNPVVEFAKKAIETGEYGDVITTAARRVSSFPARIKDVGVIMDLGIHDIDIMRYLLGSEAKSVFCLGGMQRHEYEDFANILLSFENEVSGFIEVNWLTPMKVRKLALTCTKNFAELDYAAQTIEISSATLTGFDPFNLYQTHFEFDVRQVSLKKQEPLKRELEDFLGAIAEKRRPLVTGEEATRSLEVALAAVESQKSGKRMDLG